MESLLDIGVQEGNGEGFELTFLQRMLGFGATAIIGLFSGALSLIAMALLRIRKFTILFAICNCMILSSTGFLIGFKKQLRSLCERKRWIGSIGMLGGILITFFFAFTKKSLLGVTVGFVIDFTSFAYYALSYLPWGTQVFHRIFRF
jgi:hypothetical protein